MKNQFKKGNKQHREVTEMVRLMERSEQRIACVYCDVVSRVEITRLESREDRNYRTVPTGYGYEL